jgi:alanine-synthesizing transaminase
VILSGATHRAKSFVEGFTLLASLRLCANVPAQYAIQTALGGYQSIDDLVAPTGRLCKQRDLIHYKMTDIPGITCVKPKGALYLFPKIDLKKFSFKDDEQFTFDLLCEQKVLVVSGTGFNYIKPDHFRIVFLASTEELETASGKIRNFLDHTRVKIDELEMA